MIHTIKTYQGIGPYLWKDCLYNMPADSAVCLSTSMAYPYICLNYHFFFISNDDFVKDDTFCIHWYNGGSTTKYFLNSFDINDIDPNRSVCHKYIHKINQL